MLDALRNATKSMVAKILFGLLVLSFAVWGIGDIFRGRGFAVVVAEVGDQRITGNEFIAEYQRYIQQLRPAFGGDLDIAKANQLGLQHQVLQRLVGQAVFDQGAQDLDIAVSKDVIRANIMSDPNLQGPGGAFDQIKFREMLMKSGYTEEGFVETITREISRSELTGSIRLTGYAPKTMVDALFRLREEARTADYVEVRDAAFEDVGEPDEAAITAYYEKYADIFTAPEYRAITYVPMTTKELAKDIEISDEELQQAYEDNKARFSTPERRTLRQMVLTDEDAAKRAEAMLAEGKDFAEVAKEVAHQEGDAIEIGTVTAAQIPPDLRDAAFGIAAGEVSAPVKTAFGWHIVKATEVIPGTEKTFDEVKDELRRELAEDRARDEIDGLTNRFEDMLAGGATIEEAAAELGLEAHTVAALDARGLDAAGEPVPLPSKNIVATAFESQEGAASPLTDIGNDGYFVLRVDKITPSAVRPLDSIRDVVASGWKGEERHKRAQARADEIAAEVKGGKTLQDAAVKYDLTVKASEPFRRGQTEIFPESLVRGLFADGTGTAATGESPDGYIVAVVKEIQPADPAANKEALDATQQQLNGAVGTDYLVQYGAALERRYPVEINQERLDSLF